MNPTVFIGLNNNAMIDYVKKNVSKLSHKSIAKAIEASLGISFDEIKGKSRKREIADARFIFLGIIKEKGIKMTLKSLGNMLNRDHSTIIYGNNVYDDLLETNFSFKKKVTMVINRLENPHQLI